MNSDHLPILIKLKAELDLIPTKDQVYVNYAKADWEGFRDYTEEKFASAQHHDNPLKGEKVFSKIINDAAKKFIPKGRIPKIVHNIPTEAATLINERDQILENDRDDPRLHDINNNIKNKIKEHRTSKWREHLDKCARGSHNLWRTVKNISQPSKEANNTNIKFGNVPVSKNAKIANLFNRQFTPAPNYKPSQQFRNTLRKLKNKKSEETYDITIQQTTNAIKTSKASKAIGPDGMSPIMLKKIGPKGISYLTHVFNRAVNTSSIPQSWKTGKIIPLLKPKKSFEVSKSYRPISLLSPLAKVLEKIILPDLEAAMPLKDHQHGFRRSRSTVTALQETVNFIERGLNSKKPARRTVLVAIDLSKAFDTVSHEILLMKILDLNICHTLKKFLSAYLRGRQQYTVFRGCKSKARVVRQGVPQGGVLSPLLFNLYLSSLPDPPADITLFSYADDCQALSAGPIINDVCDTLNPYLNTLFEWFKTMKLEISPEKSTATLFTTWSNEVNRDLPIYINGEKVPTERHPKILGVHLDSMFNFGYHSKQMKEKVQSKNNILKCLAGSTWGKDKEVLLDTYKAIGRSIFNYAAPIYTPFLSKSNWNELNAAQNSSLRIATGCTRMSEVTHLNRETKIIPVRDHSEMLTSQYLLAMHQNSHPNHQQLSQPRPPRDKRNSIFAYKSNITHHIGTRTYISKDEYKIMNKRVHTEYVSNAISSYERNKVLHDTPAHSVPDINEEEKELPRSTRTTLAQLRSSYSPHLNTYLHRIGSRDSDLCPKCNLEPHTSNHLFNCPSNPTTLVTKDLWEKPKRVAEFLDLPTTDDSIT